MGPEVEQRVVEAWAAMDEALKKVKEAQGALLAAAVKIQRVGSGPSESLSETWSEYRNQVAKVVRQIEGKRD